MAASFQPVSLSWAHHTGSLLQQCHSHSHLSWDGGIGRDPRTGWHILSSPENDESSQPLLQLQDRLTLGPASHPLLSASSGWEMVASLASRSKPTDRMVDNSQLVEKTLTQGTDQQLMNEHGPLSDYLSENSGTDSSTSLPSCTASASPLVSVLRIHQATRTRSCTDHSDTTWSGFGLHVCEPEEGEEMEEKYNKNITKM